MFRRSGWLFLIIFILMILIATPMFILNNSMGEVRDSAKRINDLGFIRGGIQRYTKLKLSGISNNSLEAKIDSLIDHYILEEWGDSTNKEWEYVSDLEILHRKWENLKALIEENVKTPSDMNLDMIMLKSEECWSIANYMVLQKQYSSQERASSFNYFMAILGVDLVVVLLLLLLVKRFVRDSLEVSNIYDPLTKVFNRRYFEEYIESKIVRVRKSRGVFSLIMLDIDYFKNVNDTYGHGVGDYVLETLAQVVKENIRKSDNLFRIGGEEFMIVLPDTTSEIAMKLAERVRKSVEEYSFNYVDKITISLGITQFKGDDEPETMMRKVDRALYRAKNNGRNRVEVEFNSPEFETTI